MLRQALILFVLLIAYSCSEIQIPEPTNGEPIFFIETFKDGSPLKLTAGVEDFYMYADHELDAFDVYVHTSTVAKVEPGEEKFELRIRSHTKSNGLVPDIRKSITGMEYKYKEPSISESFAGLKFIPIVSGSGPFIYLWDFGDGSSSMEESPVHRYDHPGFYKITLTVSNASGCNSSVVNVVDMFNFTLGNLDECNADFTHTSQGINSIQFNSVNQTADNYYWDFGDGSSSFSQNPLHNYSGSGTFKVMHTTYRQSDSCVAEMYRNVLAGSGSGSCIANFNIERITTGTPDSLALSRITVVYTDKLGEEFRSDNLHQDEDSYFRIISVDDYIENEKGHPSLKYSCEFGCKLANANGSREIVLTKSIGNLALSYSP